MFSAESLYSLPALAWCPKRKRQKTGSGEREAYYLTFYVYARLTPDYGLDRHSSSCKVCGAGTVAYWGGAAERKSHGKLYC